ncbi:GlyGly-CTERM sorting domain-containing protein [Shewanella sp. SM102]|nr:GlyGly-CTERM sorting domain-containing protein [Shewanella sp. SM71]MCU8097957.1 GlyGly-CTERM sorting domain-containing protein [Shewanella sp. SM102]
MPPKPEPKPKDDGGALGYLGLALMSLFGLQRRRR